MITGVLRYDIEIPASANDMEDIPKIDNATANFILPSYG
jgi:hypothetical protein